VEGAVKTFGDGRAGVLDEAATAVRDALAESVRLHMRSDVPVGSCLSGGLDSSSIVCIASRQPKGEKQDQAFVMETFSSCFLDPRYDEREFIESVVNETGVRKNLVFPSTNGFREDLQELVYHQDEPFANAGIYAQWCVLRAARGHGIIVMLDGQGGDEQLGGYRKFYFFYLAELLRRGNILKFGGEACRFLASLQLLKTLRIREGFRYNAVTKKIFGPMSVLRKSFAAKFRNRDYDLEAKLGLGTRLKADLFQFSLPVLLRYEDRNSMAHSVESRLPFLDFRLAQFIASLPVDQKLRGGWTKFILRCALKGILPEKVRLRRSKLGFATPQAEWTKEILIRSTEDVHRRRWFVERYADPQILRSHVSRDGWRFSGDRKSVV
jgi:asparagine synthase (glutamine-hydrolysing)